MKPIRIYEEGKIDIHKRKEKFEIALERFRSNKRILPENKRLILTFLRDCELGKTIKHKAKKKIAVSRLLRYVQILSRVSIWLNKPFDKVNQKDMEDFVTSLEKDKLRRKDGKKFGEETKADLKKAVRKFYKWLLGDNKHYPELVDWIDTSIEMKEVPALTREEVQRLVNQTGSIRNKAIIMVLFDSGARIEELLNVRLKHLTKKEDYYMIRIEHGFSKTAGRTVSLPMCTRFLEDWFSMHPAKDNSEAQLFPVTYSNLRTILKRLGDKVLNKNVTAHLLRHSSATYYSNKLIPYQLCYRYGWSMASKQPARYIDRNGIYEQETAKIIKADEVSTVKEENQELREDLRRLRAQFNEINELMIPLVKDPKLLGLLLKKVGEKGLAEKLRQI